MKTITLFWIFIVCVSCFNNASKSNIIRQDNTASSLNIYVLDTLKTILTKNVNEVKNFHYPDGISLRDTVFESDDESQWKGFVFYNKSKRLLFIETSWENEKIIKRITIVSSDIVGTNGLKIGAKFIDISPYLSQIIPSYPDGYFGLKVKNDSQITCFFDINNNSDLSIGNVKFETIPDNLVVEQILIE